MVEQFDCFNVLAHCDYPAPYFRISGVGNPFDRLKYEFEPILKLLIEKGKGIEQNISGLRQLGGTTMPSAEILGVYRECGGEIITIGSDAHHPHDVGEAFHQGVKLLKAAGVQYLACFNQMKVEFKKL